MKKASVIKPPRIADKLFQWYCAAAKVEDLHGDMEELFYHNLERMSIQKAKWKYCAQVLSLMFSYAIKKRKQQSSFHYFSSSSNTLPMLKNYFKVAFRSLARQRFFTIINVVGLAIGMSISLLFIAMVSFVASYDVFHVNKDRIYRVITHVDDKNRSPEYASAPAPLGEMLKEKYSGIEKVVRINASFSAEAKYGKQEIPLSGYFVDPEFLDVFTFPLLKGSAATALDKPNGLLITEEAAKKIFNDEDPYGKIVTMGDLGEFEITGVLKDNPKNSHMRFEVLTSYGTLLALQRDKKIIAPVNEWKVFRDSYVYFLLPGKNDVTGIGEFLNSATAENYSKEKDFKASFQLQALSDIAPGRELRNQIGPDWDYSGFMIFGVLTLLILVPACFNYANISIARTLKRAKEIGLRKVVGGQRHQVFFQFIVETVIIMMIALVGAYFIFTVVRWEFLAMITPSSSSGLDLGTNLITWICFILFTILVGLLAGGIPAFYFARLNPIQALKNSSSIKSITRVSFRKVLIVFQFALSLGFIMSVVIVMRQYRTAVNYNFGFNKENILDVKLINADPERFRNEFSKLSAVSALSMSSNVAGTTSANSNWIKPFENNDSIEVYNMSVDHQYMNNLGLTLIAGKQFSDVPRENGNNAVIVNETFLKRFKIANPAEALGKTFLLTDKREIKIRGVVKDFHYMYLTLPIESFYFYSDPSQYQYANLKIASTDTYATFSALETAWKSMGQENKLDAAFFDDEIKDAYNFYFSMIKICGFMGTLAISISCLGLLGMVVYTVETRTKEIGVRKVMGASVFDITFILSKSFIKLMLIAAVIATPITYYFFDKIMLSLQYYRERVGIWEVVISLAIMLIAGVSTVMTQTVRAAKVNPVDTLRYE